MATLRRIMSLSHFWDGSLVATVSQVSGHQCLPPVVQARGTETLWLGGESSEFKSGQLGLGKKWSSLSDLGAPTCWFMEQHKILLS